MLNGIWKFITKYYMIINLQKQKCGISHFFRDEWCGKNKKIQISAIELNLTFLNEYWNNFNGIVFVRKGNASVFDIYNLRIMYFMGSFSYFPENVYKLYYERQSDQFNNNKNTQNGSWIIILSKKLKMKK